MSHQHLKLDVGRRPYPQSGSAPDVPATPHRAYVAGLDAARRGDDLAVVVHDALRSWPMDDGLGELAELITCASLGYWTEGGVR